MSTMFERLGGFTVVRKIVTDFYDTELNEPVVAPFVDGIDMRRPVDHRTKFIACETGEPSILADDLPHSSHRNFAGRTEADRVGRPLRRDG